MAKAEIHAKLVDENGKLRRTSSRQMRTMRVSSNAGSSISSWRRRTT